MIQTPADPAAKHRHHKLHGKLATTTINGQAFDQWQYEVTSGGRIWFCVDEPKRTVWLKAVSIGHPKATDR